MASRLTHYAVYLCSYDTWAPKNHHTIFIARVYDENSCPARGYRLHVTGNIQQGMEIETLDNAPAPFTTATLVEWVRHEGWIRHEDLDRVVEICNEVPPPAKQFDGPRRLVPRGVPLRHCQHWTAEALDAMRAGGVLEPLPEGEGDSNKLITSLEGMRIE